jgi:beta-glucosidase
MSDWCGTYSVDHALNAGLDLEMPGINKWRSLDLVSRSIQSRKVTLRTIKTRAKSVLELVQKCAQGAPEVRFINVLLLRAATDTTLSLA